MAHHLRTGLGLDLVEVDNEANLAALAHLWPHKLAGDDFLYVSGDVGIGGGLVTGGTLYPGVSGFAGELGHLTIEREGRRCRCGSQGCVEQYAGLDAILGGAGLDDILALSNALAEADIDARGAVARAGAALGVALASVINLCDLATVVLGGCYAEIFETLAPALGAELERRTLAADSRPTTVLAAPVRSDAAVRGGAALVARRACNEPERLIRLKSTGSLAAAQYSISRGVLTGGLAAHFVQVGAGLAGFVTDAKVLGVLGYIVSNLGFDEWLR